MPLSSCPPPPWLPAAKTLLLECGGQARGMISQVSWTNGIGRGGISLRILLSRTQPPLQPGCGLLPSHPPHRTQDIVLHSVEEVLMVAVNPVVHRMFRAPAVFGAVVPGTVGTIHSCRWTEK